MMKCSKLTAVTVTVSVNLKMITEFTLQINEWYVTKIVSQYSCRNKGKRIENSMMQTLINRK